MKAVKLLLALGLLTGAAHSATINISAGTPAQGFLVTRGGLATTSHFVAVGSWDVMTSTWTQFGSTLTDTGKVNGQIIASSPTSLNGSVIHLFVGLVNSPAAGGGDWVSLRSNANAAFPADGTGTGAVTFAATVPSTLAMVLKGKELVQFGLSGTTNTIDFVPEPSTTLLGLLGLAGLIRRRR
jgi:hypothetical protein